MTKDEHLDEIFTWFDFAKVHRTMVLLDWKWVEAGPEIDFSVPTEDRIREVAFDLLSRAYDKAMDTGEEYYIATGGLVATYNPEWGHMSLQFVVADWDTND